MDTVGNPIFFHDGQPIQVMQNALADKMSEKLNDRDLALVVMGRLAALMEAAGAEGRPPVIARTHWFGDNHIFEIAIFSGDGEPDVFSFSIPNVIDANVSGAMLEAIQTFVAISGGITDIAVCQILCNATNDPWSVLGGKNV